MPLRRRQYHNHHRRHRRSLAGRGAMSALHDIVAAHQRREGSFLQRISLELARLGPRPDWLHVPELVGADMEAVQRYAVFAGLQASKAQPLARVTVAASLCLIPESLMIGHHFSASAFTSAPSGDPKSEPPRCLAMLWCLSRLSRSSASRRSGNVPGCLATWNSG